MARRPARSNEIWSSRPAALSLRHLRHYLLAVLFYAVLFTLFFSPVIFRGKLLAVGSDTLYNFLPYFYSTKVQWDPLVFAGFPMMADPTAMAWYPLAWIISSATGSWNLFLLAAYVIGSFGIYGYVYRVTQSSLSALVSGTVFGLSGFMIAHLGHPHIVQSAVWMPLLIWSLESQRRILTARWFIPGSLAATFAFLGGQPQIFCYGLILAVAYLIVNGWNALAGRRRYWVASLVMIALGIGIAAVQILPTLELVKEGSRAAYTFTDYSSHSLPPLQLLTLIFPFVFGGPSQSAFIPYFGATNQTELSGYVGLLPLVLAATALGAKTERRLAIFWLVVALGSLLLAMGDATALARIIFHIPVLNSFRAPGRHFLEFTLAASALSGFGVAAILQRKISKRTTVTMAIFAVLIMVATLGLLLISRDRMGGLAAAAGRVPFSLMPWTNRAVGLPLVIFVIVLAAYLFWCRKPASRLIHVLILAVVVVDVGSFGWFFEWRYSAINKNDLAAPEIDLRYRDLLEPSNQRLMPIRSAGAELKVAQPNLSRLWGVPSADGYNALILRRTSKLLDVNERGERLSSWRAIDYDLDLMDVRYVFMSPHRTLTDSAGVRWFADDWQQFLGLGCDPSGRTSFTISLPAPVTSTALGVVSRLACSSSLTDGTEVAQVRLVDTNDQVTTRTLLAGRDTSEWAYDCQRVRPAMRHQRATIFSNYPAQMYDTPCTGHFYVSKLNLEGRKEIKRLEFDWVQGPASLIVEKLSLFDDPSASSYPLDAASSQPDRWRLAEETAEARVYENLRAMPRVWLTSEVVTVTADEALGTIKSGMLKDGRAFDPHQIALIEEPANFPASPADKNAAATVISLSDKRMEVRTVSKAASFLVTSDAYYPGWRALVDGQETKLYRTDYAIRGLVLPPGEHHVSFVYRPRSFYLGAAVSVFSLIILIVIGTWWRPRTK